MTPRTIAIHISCIMGEWIAWDGINFRPEAGAAIDQDKDRAAEKFKANIRADLSLPELARVKFVVCEDRRRPV